MAGWFQHGAEFHRRIWWCCWYSYGFPYMLFHGVCSQRNSTASYKLQLRGALHLWYSQTACRYVTCFLQHARTESLIASDAHVFFPPGESSAQQNAEESFLFCAVHETIGHRNWMIVLDHLCGSNLRSLWQTISIADDGTCAPQPTEWLVDFSASRN